jgi:hypothetical protein
MRLTTWPRAAAGGAAAFFLVLGSARPLGALRIGVAAVLLFQALACAANVDVLFGPDGLVPGEINDAAHPAPVPRLRWLLDGTGALGLDAAWAVRGVFLAYVAALVGLLLGRPARAMAITAWLLHWVLMSSAWMTTYGVDAFAGIALFYCACFPVGDAFVPGVPGAGPSAAARLGRRVLQCHLCIVYFASGLEKASGEQWWNGEAIWRAAMRPDFAVWDYSWVAEVPWLPRALAWATLLVEAGYPAMMWWKATRRTWLIQVVGLHLGIGLFMGLHAFAALMLVLNVAAWAWEDVPDDLLANPRKATHDHPSA